MNTLLQLLAGTWFVVSSNFPMWLKGNKTDPQFHYTIIQRKGLTVLDDRVTYLKNQSADGRGGKLKSIHGYDRPESESKFTWRGHGLLSFAKSKWEVRLMDEEHQWAVIYFSKTLFTPEGVDIISRNKDLSEKVIDEIRRKMKSDSLLAPHLETVVNLKLKNSI